MPTVSVRIDGVKEAMAMFDLKKVAQAKKWALGEVGRAVKKEGEMAILEKYNLQKSDFKANVKLLGIKDDTLTILITPQRRNRRNYFGIPDSYFGAIQINGSKVRYRMKSKKLKVQGKNSKAYKTASQSGTGGVVVQIEKSGKTVNLKNAFIIQMKSGYVGVFVREKNKMMVSKPKKQAIMEMAMVSFPSLFENKDGKDKEPMMRMKQMTYSMWRETFLKKLGASMGVSLTS